MGYLTYEDHDIEFDDRTLAHLHIVIVNKLRHGQSFAMSWRDPAERGGGRTSIWLHPAVTLRFHFDGSRTPALNRDWLTMLADSADSSRGLVVEREENIPAPTDAPHITLPDAQGIRGVPSESRVAVGQM
ncbi:ATP-dependent DNA ligase [Leifsonia sp. NPDC080035]|uniref:ATP-dependent DNA ligase n=1 Tax=Leifsonia sp. NPDC080035 TaxID=3143936 RepID=A0AAU7G7X0_9MICO